MTDWPNLLGVVGAFVASAFALMRMTLNQQKALTDRFVGFLEASLRNQESTILGFRQSVDQLRDTVQENTVVVRHIAERLKG